MYERRLKVFLLLLGIVFAALAARAAHVQVVAHDYWTSQAAEVMKRVHLTEAPRGRILDYQGRALAIDQPCIDVCVDYRAIQDPPDDTWVTALAKERLHGPWGDSDPHATREQRQQKLADAVEEVKSDIRSMWLRLGQAGGQTQEEIDEERQAIVRRVWMRQHYAWFHSYAKALERRDVPGDTPGWRKFLADSASQTPEFDSFTSMTVAEQIEPHVILPAVTTDVQNALGKDIDHYPGLVLRPGTHRYYPFGDVGCHLLGSLTHVNPDDIKHDPDAGDELRQYLPNDLKGSNGIEALCEPTLRGTRRRIERVLGDEAVLSSAPPVTGGDVHLSVDIELQQAIQTAFAKAHILDNGGHVVEDTVLHGAAVVIDVKTSAVRALVSYPTFDLNTLEEQYAKLHDDDLNEPLLNRATMAQREPGSTAKPITGMAGVTEGVVGVDEGIECTGFLVLDGIRYSNGRCWVASKFLSSLGIEGVKHHQVPSAYPHPTGFLTLADALERSCNVYFETVADRLKLDRLSLWESKFGLGRPTGIGITEFKGRVLATDPVRSNPVKRRWETWLGAIGEGWVAATPIQMANVAATIARSGLWERPTLLATPPGSSIRLREDAFGKVPEREDLHVAPEAMGAAWVGMYNVVNAGAGTGTTLVANDPELKAARIAGKTGTAQTSRLRVKKRDAAGKVMYDEKGQVIYDWPEPSTPEQPNPRAPWYRGTVTETGTGKQKTIDHAWYIGFAPADHPQIAFAVMVEYGGSGGIAAASVAREALTACIHTGYLKVNSTGQPPVASAD